MLKITFFRPKFPIPIIGSHFPPLVDRLPTFTEVLVILPFLQKKWAKMQRWCVILKIGWKIIQLNSLIAIAHRFIDENESENRKLYIQSESNLTNPFWDEKSVRNGFRLILLSFSSVLDHRLLHENKSEYRKCCNWSEFHSANHYIAM